MNLINAHKVELSRVLRLVIWDGSTFGDKLINHIFLNSVDSLANYPAIFIRHVNTDIFVLDTGTNIHSNTYRIRSFFPYSDANIAKAEDNLDELCYLITDKFSEFMFGDNSTWETLTYTSGGEEGSIESDGLVFKDVMIKLTNEVTRNNNYL